MCVPFLSYLACAVENKQKLDEVDIALVISIALMILFGFAMVITTNIVVSSIFLFLSTFFMLIFMAVTTMTTVIKPNIRDYANIYSYIEAMQKLFRKNLLIKLVYIFPYFPTIYFLGMINVLGPDGVLSGYMIGSVVGKLVFSSILIDSHIQLQDDFNIIVTSKETSDLAVELGNLIPLNLPSKFSQVYRRTILDCTYDFVLLLIFIINFDFSLDK